MAQHDSWAKNPIRLSGTLALALLLAPGSFSGLAMLLAHAGYPAPLPAVRPATHGQVQLFGYFLMLIWGFLVHGLPGMLGADLKRTRAITPWMLAMAAALFCVWLADFLDSPPQFRFWASVLVVLPVIAGTVILEGAALRGSHGWRESPFPLLIIPLAFPPAAAVLWLAGFAAVAAHLMLWGCVIPIVFAMGYRMFSAMLRLRYPHERLFLIASVSWAAGVVLALAHLAGAPVPTAYGDIFTMVGAIGFAVSLRVFEPRRDTGKQAAKVAADLAVLRYVRTAFAFLLASTVSASLLAFGKFPGAAFYGYDAARHFAAIGFAFLLVAGLTLRLFPSFVRRRQLPVAWLHAVLVSVGLGVALRGAEVLLPATAPWVAAGALLIYGGMVAYGVLVFKTLLPAPTRAPAAARNAYGTINDGFERRSTR